MILAALGIVKMIASRAWGAHLCAGHTPALQSVGQLAGAAHTPPEVSCEATKHRRQLTRNVATSREKAGNSGPGCSVGGLLIAAAGGCLQLISTTFRPINMEIDSIASRVLEHGQ